LNNVTRRSDPKNALYLRVARFAKLFAPRFIIIENVPTVLNDRLGVVFKTKDALEKMGYRVSDGIIHLSKIGVPQSRRRHVMLAIRSDVSFRVPMVAEIAGIYDAKPRTVKWAIGDLVDAAREDRLFDGIAQTSPVTRKRIDHLFDHDLFELPDNKRPDCHRDGEHSYQAVYGRMWWDRPAPTITTGFSTMGQGRFVHPRRRRTLTPHEAARLQFFPDFFRFDRATSRKHLTELIGNAVPSKLTYVLGLEILR
jgi:DNA (cytosine-5)-methyltransferase 1